MIATQLHVQPGPAQTEGGVELYRNSPNPFIEMTLLWFRMPAPSKVVIRMFDAKGSEVVAKSGYYEAGEHHMVLHRADLREPGIYTCRLETPFGTATRKVMMY